MRKIREKGFTLIELLVVISIIALLLSILMPALTKVKNQARVIVCKSNLKQLATALETYSADNENKSITTTYEISPGVWDGHMWFLVIAPYFGDSKYKNDPKAALEGSMRTLWCPSTKEPDSIGVLGDNKHRWRFHVAGLEGEGSYGLNTWVGGMDFDMQTHPSFAYIKPGQVRKCSLRNMSARSDTPVFADSWWMEGIPMDPDQSVYSIPQSVPPYTDDPEYVGGKTDDYGMRRFCIDRHNMAINVSFADGSVDKVKLEKLWSLKWNKTFKTINRVDLK